MKLYMLDTNMVSHLMKGHPMVSARIKSLPMTSICISVVTEAELLFGLAKRPDAKKLHLIVKEFLRCVEVLPWTHTTAEHYGAVRAEMERQGRVLASLDLLIAVHALDVSATLVTHDRAFDQVPGLSLENWIAHST